MKKATVFGAGGFIGSHLVKRLKQEGYWVRGVDLKYPEFSDTLADVFWKEDLRNERIVDAATHMIDEVYQLAADMGGAGYIFTGLHDADVMHNSAMINLHTAKACSKNKVKMVFYSSSACVYPDYNQLDPDNPNCEENSAYPANPDSEYGWEKLFSERLYLSFSRNYKLNVRIARFHNIFGPEGTWNNGKEKAPAAMCRKVAEAKDGDSIEIWGSGNQTRSFLYIDECLEAIRRFVSQDAFEGPVNIGSTEKISIRGLAEMVIRISGKKLIVEPLDGEDFIQKYGYKCPLGVNGRNSHNQLYRERMGWEVSQSLEVGLRKTYEWINTQVQNVSIDNKSH